MQKNKPPEYDGLTKEFFVAFWEDIKDVFKFMSYSKT